MCVRRRGHERREGVKVFRTTGPCQLARLGQLIGDRDDIGRLAVGVEREHGVEDELVLGNVEIDAANNLDDVGDGILAEKHAAEGTLLSEQIVWGSAVARSPFGLLTRVASEPQVSDRH